MAKILVISAHPDDEVLGCGATIAKHADNGDEIYVCCLCSEANVRNKKSEDKKFVEEVKKSREILGINGEISYSFPNIGFNSVPRIEIVRAIEKAITKFEPEIIYAHFYSDMNIDHRVVFNATMAAVKLPQRSNKKQSVKKVLCYEIPSSTDWAPPKQGCCFQPNYFVDVKKYYKKKIEALKCYSGVLRDPPHPVSEELIICSMKLRGSIVGFEFAESFAVMLETS